MREVHCLMCSQRHSSFGDGEQGKRLYTSSVREKFNFEPSAEKELSTFLNRTLKDEIKKQCSRYSILLEEELKPAIRDLLQGTACSKYNFKDHSKKCWKHNYHKL